MLFVISAPSGAGKTTIIRELFKTHPELAFSVSATTRKRRPAEIEGKDYHYISLEEFEKLKADNEFVEFEEVHGNYYGTLKKEIEPYLTGSRHLVFDVDVKGALSIKKMYPEAVMIFIDVPEDELLKRLKNRNTETDAEIEKRASRIKLEVGQKSAFEFFVDNSKGLDHAVKQAEEIIEKYKK